MTSLIKYGKPLNGILLTYFFLIILLNLVGKISYGHGLGDLFYLIGAILVTTIQLVMTIILNRQKRDGKIFLITSAFFLFIAIYLTYKFTLGRGIEHSWNGNIFI